MSARKSEGPPKSSDWSSKSSKDTGLGRSVMSMVLVLIMVVVLAMLGPLR